MAQKYKEERQGISEYWVEHRRLKAIEDKKIRAIALEKKKVEMLHEVAQKWQVGNSVQAFVLRLSALGGNDDTNSKLKEWIE
jgi:hypothetical protein